MKAGTELEEVMASTGVLEEAMAEEAPVLRITLDGAEYPAGAEYAGAEEEAPVLRGTATEELEDWTSEATTEELDGTS